MTCQDPVFIVSLETVSRWTQFAVLIIIDEFFNVWKIKCIYKFVIMARLRGNDRSWNWCYGRGHWQCSGYQNSVWGGNQIRSSDHDVVFYSCHKWRHDLGNQNSSPYFAEIWTFREHCCIFEIHLSWIERHITNNSLETFLRRISTIHDHVQFSLLP